MALNPALPILGGVALAVAFYGGTKHWPTGKGPFDDWPAGMRESAAPPTRVKTKSGNVYSVTSSRPGPGDKTLNVAQLRGTKSWVSYAHHRPTGKREIYRVWSANPAHVEMMRKDFGV